MAPPVLLKPPQTPELLFRLPSFAVSLFTPHILSPRRTLTFRGRASPLTPSPLSSGLQFSPQNQHWQQQSDGDDEELVIGDCLVFEEGVFEDPYLQETFEYDSGEFKSSKHRNAKSSAEVKPENLIPEKWRELQEEINITKKERRRIARELEFDSRVEKNRKALAPIRSACVEDYLAYKKEKLSQLKPLVLDNPSFPAESEEEDDGGGNGEGHPANDSRVAPRNPRWAVYGGTLDDISEFFNSGDYDPSAAAQNSEGRRKLFTKDEKVLLKRRIPDMAAATSDKWLPLHTLTASGEFYLVNTLLKHNADINAQDKDGLAAIHKAILGKKQAVFNYLLRESANPFVRDKEGATLIHYAVRVASTQMIKILLLYNVDINLQDNDGWTPLHLAVQTRRTDVVRLLLIKGADKMLKNKDGLTALDLCLYSGRDTRTYELIKLMKQLPKSR